MPLAAGKPGVSKVNKVCADPIAQPYHLGKKSQTTLVKRHKLRHYRHLLATASRQG